MKRNEKASMTASFGSQRTARVGALAALATLGVLAICILINLLVGLLPTSLSEPDVTGSDTYKLSSASRDRVGKLDEDVMLYLICESGSAAADQNILSFLRQYEELSPHITLEIVDSASDATFIDAYGGEWPADMSVIVESARRYRVIDRGDLYYYYNSLLDMSMTAEEYASALDFYNSYDPTGGYSSQFMTATTVYFDGDSRVTNALGFVTRERVSVAYVYTGAGASVPDARFENLLLQSGYDVRSALSMAAVGENCDVLMIHAPTVDMEAAEATALSEYLAGGGHLLLTTGYRVGKLEHLNGVLSAYGMCFEDELNVVYENHSAYALYDSAKVYPHIFEVHRAQHAVSGDFVDRCVAYLAHQIVVTKEVPEGVTVTPWLYTSEKGCIQWNRDGSLVADEENSVCNVGVIAEKGETKILWLSSPDMLSEQVSSGYAEGGNFELMLSALGWMTGADGDTITIPSAAMNTAYLTASTTTITALGLILVILLPLGVAVAGVAVWQFRKKRS